jgi:beta-lactamase regulating signal transducer with metallopeptidase domain
MLFFLPRPVVLPDIEMPLILNTSEFVLPGEGAVETTSQFADNRASVDRSVVPFGEDSFVERVVAYLSVVFVVCWSVAVMWRLVVLIRAGRGLRLWRKRAVAVPFSELPPGIYKPGLEVKYSNDVKTPLVTGFLRPCILLPTALQESLGPDEFRQILNHEIAHVQRGDHWAAIVQCALEAIYIYNPVIHWVSRAVRRERERSCDDIAVGNDPDRTSYAECLLKVTRHGIGVPRLVVGAIHNRSDLSSRIDRLLGESLVVQRPARRAIVAILTLVMVGLGVLLSSAMPRIGAAQSSDSDAEIGQARILDTSNGLGARLVDAVLHGHLAEANSLIVSGANVDYRVEGDGTPLIIAARRGDMDLVQLLLDSGASIDLSSDRDGNPLIMAAAAGRIQVVQKLVDHGANVNAVVERDETPLINASANGHLAVVKYLVKHGADVNLAILANPSWRPERRSPLNQAIKYGRTSVIDYLTGVGATP